MAGRALLAGYHRYVAHVKATHIQIISLTRLPKLCIFKRDYIDGLAQDCSNYIANALELLQSCTKPSIYWSEENLVTVYLAVVGPRENGRHFTDIFKCIFLNEDKWISINISLKFVPKGKINNIPAFVQIMACRQPGDKQLSKQMMASLSTHICVTWPQWVMSSNARDGIFWLIWSIPNLLMPWFLNTLRLRQNGHHFADDLFKLIFFKENCCIFIEISLKYITNGPIYNNPALVQIMAWSQTVGKPLSEPIMA